MKKNCIKKNLAGTKQIQNIKLAPKKTNQLLPQHQNKQIQTLLLEKPKQKTTIQQNSQLKSLLPNADIIEKKYPIFSEEETRITQEQSNFDSIQIVEKSQKINAELAHHIDDIWQYVLERQKKYQIDPNYLRNQKRMNQKSRNNLVRQLFNIYNAFSLERTTLYLAIFYMDLYFSRINTFKDITQIVGVAQACMLIAMKYQEIYPPQLTQWMNNRFINQVIQYEAKVLKVLDYQISHYTLQHFFHFIVWKQNKFQQKSGEIELKALFLMDLSLFQLSMKQFKVSQLARCMYYYSENRLSECDKNIVINIKWMIEKNAQSIQWLSNHNYRGIDLKFLC